MACVLVHISAPLPDPLAPAPYHSHTTYAGTLKHTPLPNLSSARATLLLNLLMGDIFDYKPMRGANQQPFSPSSSYSRIPYQIPPPPTSYHHHGPYYAYQDIPPPPSFSAPHTPPALGPVPNAFCNPLVPPSPFTPPLRSSTRTDYGGSTSYDLNLSSGTQALPVSSDRTAVMLTPRPESTFGRRGPHEYTPPTPTPRHGPPTILFHAPSPPPKPASKPRRKRQEALREIKHLIHVFRIEPWLVDDSIYGRNVALDGVAIKAKYITPIMDPPLLAIFRAFEPPEGLVDSEHGDDGEEAAKRGSEPPSFPHQTIDPDDEEVGIPWLTGQAFPAPISDSMHAPRRPSFGHQTTMYFKTEDIDGTAFTLPAISSGMPFDSATLPPFAAFTSSVPPPMYADPPEQLEAAFLPRSASSSSSTSSYHQRHHHPYPHIPFSPAPIRPAMAPQLEYDSGHNNYMAAFDRPSHPRHHQALAHTPLLESSPSVVEFSRPILRKVEPSEGLSRPDVLLSDGLTAVLMASVAAPPPRDHICSVCKKGFERPATLQAHMTVHSGERPYICSVPTCRRRFSVRSNLHRHLRKHGIDPRNITSAPASLSSARTGAILAMVKKKSGLISSSFKFRNHDMLPPPPPPLSPSLSCESEDDGMDDHDYESENRNGGAAGSVPPVPPPGDDYNHGGCRGEAGLGPYKTSIQSEGCWIPPSLRHVANVGRLSHQPPFDLRVCGNTTVCVPLQPVQPRDETSELGYEERDSFNVDGISETPYHPSQWRLRPVLPGPAPPDPTVLMSNTNHARRYMLASFQ